MRKPRDQEKKTQAASCMLTGSDTQTDMFCLSPSFFYTTKRF